MPDILPANVVMMEKGIKRRERRSRMLYGLCIVNPKKSEGNMMQSYWLGIMGM
jgi:hypothetical protein